MTPLRSTGGHRLDKGIPVSKTNEWRFLIIGFEHGYPGSDKYSINRSVESSFTRTEWCFCNKTFGQYLGSPFLELLRELDTNGRNSDGCSPVL